jgi:ribonuclease HII
MPDFRLEAEWWQQGMRLIAGVDEAGRGPLAGPVVVAAVILPRDWQPDVLVDDSKRMRPAAREAAYQAIRRDALAWRVVAIGPAEIDRLNILRATLLGMARAVQGLRPAPDAVLVDGNQAPAVTVQGRTVQCRTVVRGDGLSLSVAAASVLAKVLRDRIMRVYARRFPQWGFAEHKGYPTAAHRAALGRWGPSPIHRASFRWQKDAPLQGERIEGQRIELEAIALDGSGTGQPGASLPREHRPRAAGASR